MLEKEIVFGRKSQKTNSTIFVSEQDFQIPPGEDSLRIPILHINKIQKNSIHSEKFLSLFMFQDFCMWWFIHPTIYPEIKKILHFIIKFRLLLEKEKPTKITITDDFTMFEIIKQICKEKNLKFDYSNKNFLKFKALNKIKFNVQKYRYEKITNKKINTRKKIFSQKLKKIPYFKNKIIFVIPSIYRRPKLNYKTGKSENGEYVQQHLIDAIDDEIIGIDLDYTFKGTPDILEQRLNSELPWIPLEILLSNKDSNSNCQKFMNQFKKTISDNDFKRLFVFDGIFYWQQIEHLFKKFTYYPYIPFYLDIIRNLEDFFHIQPPKAIFLPYETGPLALAFIVLARKHNVKTFGIQHGIIFQYSPMYSFEQFLTNDDSTGFPLPDHLLLFGNYSKNILRKNGYPEDKLFILGHPEFFEFNKIKELLSKQNLREKYKIIPQQKIILFTTGKLQPYYADHGKYDYDVRVWEHLLKNFAGNNHYFVILKPHPSESNTKIYEDLLQNYHCNNFIIKNANLHELIYLSSVVVSIGSTTIIDSLCFNKPVLQVIFENKQFLPMLEENEVVLTTNLSDLSRNILKALTDEKILTLLENNRSKFLKDQYNFPEGNSEHIKKILSL